MDQDTGVITIDHHLGINVSLREYNNECKALEDLRNGLTALYQVIKKAESNYLIQYPVHRGWQDDLKIQSEDEHFARLLPNYFHWYANSMMNFIRLAGYVVQRANGSLGPLNTHIETNEIKTRCNEYINSISEIQNLKIWRHKVSAHFALTDPKKDNPAALIQSIVQPIAFWINHRFTTGTLEGYVEDDLANFPQWSLTLIHEKLASRFWPINFELSHEITGIRVRQNRILDSGEFDVDYSAQISEYMLQQEGAPSFDDDYRISAKFNIDNKTSGI